MIVHKIRKLIAALLSLTLTGTMIPCGAANLVPFNAGKPVVSQSSPVTRPVVKSNPSSDGFSMQSLESRVDNIVATKEKAKQNKGLQEAYSGDCGNNAHWNLNTGTGLLTIFGSGRMNDFSAGYNWLGQFYTNCPWWGYRDSIKTVEIREGITYIGENLIPHSTSTYSYDCL